MQNYEKIISELAWCAEGARHTSFRSVCLLSSLHPHLPLLTSLHSAVHIFIKKELCVLPVKHQIHFIRAITVSVTDMPVLSLGWLDFKDFLIFPGVHLKPHLNKRTIGLLAPLRSWVYFLMRSYVSYIMRKKYETNWNPNLGCSNFFCTFVLSELR